MASVNHRGYKAEVWDIMQSSFAKSNDHQIHGVIQFESHIDADRLGHAVDLLTDSFPLIRCRFVEGAGAPCWEDAGWTAHDMLFLQESDELDREIEEVLYSKTDTSRGPQLIVSIIRGKSKDSLCVIINHMLCDGAGFKELLYGLSSIYSHLRVDSDYKPACQDGPRSAGQVLRAFGLRGRMRILSQRYGLSRYDDCVVFGLEGDRKTPFIVTHTIARERFLRAKSFAREYGATVNDVMLAAYLRALQQRVPGQTTAIQCVLDLRKFLPSKGVEGICNLTSSLVCDIGSDVGETLGDTLMKVKRVMDVEKESLGCLHLIMLLEVLFRVLPYPVARWMVSKGYRNPPLAMSNIGIIDHKRLCFDRMPIKNAFITGSIKYNPFFQLALSTFKDEVTMSVAFHGTQADQDDIRQFLKRVDEELSC